MAKYTEAEAVEFETVRTATERTREILESIDKQVTMMMRMTMDGKDFFSSLYSNLTPSTFYYSTLAASGWSPIMTLYGHPLRPVHPGPVFSIIPSNDHPAGPQTNPGTCNSCNTLSKLTPVMQLVVLRRSCCGSMRPFSGAGGKHFF